MDYHTTKIVDAIREACIKYDYEKGRYERAVARGNPYAFAEGASNPNATLNVIAKQTAEQVMEIANALLRPVGKDNETRESCGDARPENPRA